MKSLVKALVLLLMVADSAQARSGGQRDMRCLVEVLHSEELPIGPLFYHTVKATLLVSTQDAAIRNHRLRGGPLAGPATAARPTDVGLVRAGCAQFVL